VQSRAHEALRGETTVLDGADGALRGKREFAERVRGPTSIAQRRWPPTRRARAACPPGRPRDRCGRSAARLLRQLDQRSHAHSSLFPLLEANSSRFVKSKAESYVDYSTRAVASNSAEDVDDRSAMSEFLLSKRHHLEPRRCAISEVPPEVRTLVVFRAVDFDGAGPARSEPVQPFALIAFFVGASHDQARG
jgi:hypothetical protein